MATIDPSVLLELEKYSTPGTGDIVAELIRVYLASSEAPLKEMRGNMDRKAFEVLAGVAHSQKSSAGSVGAKSLQACLATIESAAKEKNLGLIGDLIGEMEGIYRQVQSELTDLLKKRP